MVGAAARFDGNERCRELLEVSDHLDAPEVAADNHGLVLISAVELEHRLEVSMPIRTGMFTGLSSHLA